MKGGGVLHFFFAGLSRCFDKILKLKRGIAVTDAHMPVSDTPPPPTYFPTPSYFSHVGFPTCDGEVLLR